MIVIAILSFLRSSPMSWSPGRRAASRTLDDDRWRRTASYRHSDTDMGTGPVCRAPRKHQGPESSQQ